MIFGWVLGRRLLVPRPRLEQARSLGVAGAFSLGLFALVRGVDGYGNWNLYRESSAALQWLHVSKYPPSLAFGCLELGIGLLLLALFAALDDPDEPRPALAILSLLGGTALFYYLLHVHLMKVVQWALAIDTGSHGLEKTWIAGLATVGVLLWPCAWFRRYKSARPGGWTRYI
jgi:uncharacterized membrane protein